MYEIELDKETAEKGILHQINYMVEMKDLAEVVNRFGAMIKIKSREVIELLKDSK